jgi:phosphoglycerate-specific signal transduction histidine kinase
MAKGSSERDATRKWPGRRAVADGGEPPDLAALAHELNQPLSAISNYARGAILRIEAGAEAAVLLDVMQKIAAQAVRAGDIVHRLQSALSTADNRHR